MSQPKIPQYITVHLGPPDSPARNVTVPFASYIKNVASSEIYPTWNENALRANIYAITTFALNRIYTEYYRTRGYNFDITNDTAYDQAFIYQRDIYSNISRIVDELFNDYIVRQGQIQPLYAQYCNGTTATCVGLSQWGSQYLAESGLSPYDILTRYYGPINIVKNAPVTNITESYPGIPLKLGSIGEDVRTIQRELNRISENYPSIPNVPVNEGIFDGPTRAAVIQFQRIFNLTQDGIVGKSTWYKIKNVYTAVKQLSEVYSEGISLSEGQDLYRRVLREGDRGIEVKIVQSYLSFIGEFNESVPVITVDGIFGPKTKAAVLAFQRYYGLTQDGIVGRNTWARILDAYGDTYRNLPEEYRQYSKYIFPGYFITTGATGNVVRQLQTFIRTIAENEASVPYVNVDGIYGNQTKNAVLAIQRLKGLNRTGAVGPLTWNAIIDLYNEYS